MSFAAEQVIGKTIASVTTRDMAGRDTFKDWVTWTEVTLTFTDGTQATIAESHGEVYDDAVEYEDFDEHGEPIPKGA